jgi:hypothetical protein
MQAVLAWFGVYGMLSNAYTAVAPYIPKQGFHKV